MCCGKETHEEVKEGQGGLTRRKVLKAMGVGTGLITLGGLTGCTQLIDFNSDLMEQQVNGAVNAAGSKEGLVFGEQQVVLLAGDERITVKAVSWLDRMYGLDLVYESKESSVHSRIYSGVGEVYLYHRSEDDLITIHSKMNLGGLHQLKVAIDAIAFQPSDFFDLINPKMRDKVKKRLLRNFERVKSTHAEALQGHSLELDWNGEGVPIAPLAYIDPQRAAKQIAELLLSKAQMQIWTRGRRIPELIGVNREFFDEMTSLLSPLLSAQEIVVGQTHNTGSCVGCMGSLSSIATGGWALAFCFVPGGQAACLMAVLTTGLEAACAGYSCYGCFDDGSTSSKTGSSPPPPPPPPDCSPFCT